VFRLKKKILLIIKLIFYFYFFFFFEKIFFQVMSVIVDVIYIIYLFNIGIFEITALINKQILEIVMNKNGIPNNGE